MTSSHAEVEGFDLALPVYVPGMNRDWQTVQGMARITDKGEIYIRLQSPEAGLRLIDMQRKGELVQVAIDYRMTVSEAKKASERYVDRD